MHQKKAKIVLSYSKANVYKCPRKYYYQYVERLPRIENNRNNLPGRAIQKLFEIYINGRYHLQGSKWLYENVESITRSEYEKFESTTKFHPGETFEDVVEDVRDMIAVCSDLFVKKNWYAGSVLSEYYMSGWLTADIQLIGTADYIIKLPDNKVVILDFKSTAKGLAALDKEQLLIYSWLYKFNYGQLPNEAYFFLCRDNKLVRLNLKEEDIGGLVQRLINTGNDILAKKYEKNPSKYNCTYCPFKKVCWGSAKKCPY